MNNQDNVSLPLQWEYDDAFCSIYSVDTLSVIYQYYQTLPQTKEQLQPSLEVVLALACQMQKSHASVFYWVEVQEGQFLPSDDVTWIRKDLIPQLYHAGIRAIAYVSRHNLFRDFKLENLMAPLQDTNLTLRVFQETAQACQWLMQLQNETIRPLPDAYE